MGLWGHKISIADVLCAYPQGVLAYWWTCTGSIMYALWVEGLQTSDPRCRAWHTINICSTNSTLVAFKRMDTWYRVNGSTYLRHQWMSSLKSQWYNISNSSLLSLTRVFWGLKFLSLHSLLYSQILSAWTIDLQGVASGKMITSAEGTKNIAVRPCKVDCVTKGHFLVSNGHVAWYPCVTDAPFCSSLH